MNCKQLYYLGIYISHLQLHSFVKKISEYLLENNFYKVESQLSIYYEVNCHFKILINLI